MQIILNLFQSTPYIDLPYTIVGLMGWFALAGLLAGGILHWREVGWTKDPWRWGILVALLLATPLTILFIGLRLPVENAVPVPGIPIEPSTPVLMFFSALPWVLAAGMLGPGSAAGIGFLSGLLLAFFETHSIFTPLEISGLALVYSAAIRQPYRNWLFRLVRHPLAAAAYALIVLIPIFMFSALLGSKGSFASRMDYAFTQSWIMMLIRLGELLIASVIAELLYLFHAPIWIKIASLQPSPAEKNLQLRFFYGSVPIILALLLTLMVSDWVVAGRAAENMIRERLNSTTRMAAESLPYFLEAGQNLIQNLATPELLTLSPDRSKDELARRLRAVPYFRELFLLDESGKQVTGYPLNQLDELQLSPEERAGIRLALQGVPIQVYPIAPWPGETTAQVSFLASIRSPSGTVDGILIGRTDLGSNPFMQPALQALGATKDLNGEAIILDENQTILYHSIPSQVMEKYDGQIPSKAEFYKAVSSQGTRRMVYYQPVVGRPWAVILSVPADQAQQMALNIAVPLLILVLFITAITFLTLRWGLRLVSTSLVTLAQEATLISQGHLDNSLSVRGEDEIAQFSRAFEKMRISLKARLDDLNRLLLVSQGVASNLDAEQSVMPVLHAALGEEAFMARIVLVPEVIMNNQPASFVSYGEGPAADLFSYLDNQIFELMRQQSMMSVPNTSRTRRLIFPVGKSIPGALIALQIYHENSYLGALWVAYEKPRTFTEEEVRFLSTLVGEATLAAVNSRLYASAEIGRQRMEAVLNSTPEPVLVIDAQMQLLLLNPAALQVPGLIGASAPGTPIKDVIRQPEVLDLITHQTDQGVTSREISLTKGRIYYASISPVNADGIPVGRVCILRDITHYKELDSLKSEFVSTVSHDLRSPLTLMRGYTSMLQMVGELNDQQKAYVSKIIAGVENMSRLVNNLLDLGRIEAGIGLKIEELAVNDIIEGVITSLMPQAAQKNIRLQNNPDDCMPSIRDLKIQADPALVQQGLYNLVENAIKYTQIAGEVEVGLNCKDGVIIFEVHDTGIGIAPLDLPHMFEKFYRSGRREAYKQHGTGLGLAIVKSIAERHGGRVWVESHLGKGSIFYMAIPVKQKTLKTKE
jgi:signal transduction histidine kinase